MSTIIFVCLVPSLHSESSSQAQPPPFVIPTAAPPLRQPDRRPHPSSSRPERSAVEGPPHFAVACSSPLFVLAVVCSCCHPERIFRARRIPTNPTPPLHPFLPQNPRPCSYRPPLHPHATQLTAHSSNRKNRPPTPQKTQQIPLSSPSKPQIPPNPHQPNHFPQKNTWHTSFPPRRIIKWRLST
jgi:hypothetical protein